MGKLSTLRNIDVLILAGGLGTRIRPLIKDVPKVLAPVNGKPFMDILIDNLVAQGLRRIILCVGYLKDQVIEHFQQRDDCQIIFSLEDKPLGTGGALKNAHSLITSQNFIVLNGDSFCQVELTRLVDFHYDNQAVTTVVLTNKDNNADYGSVQLGGDGKIITSFNEKSSQSSSYVNAGIYCMNQALLKRIPERQKTSLEHNVFPNMIGKYFFGLVVDSSLIDIGTPQRYKSTLENPDISL